MHSKIYILCETKEQHYDFRLNIVVADDEDKHNGNLIVNINGSYIVAFFSSNYVQDWVVSWVGKWVGNGALSWVSWIGRVENWMVVNLLGDWVSGEFNEWGVEWENWMRVNWAWNKLIEG